MRIRLALLALALLCGGERSVLALDIAVPAYGVLTDSDLTMAAAEQGFPGAKAYLVANVPTLYTQLHVGTVVVPVDDSIVDQARASYALSASNQAQLVPLIQQTGATYSIVGWRVSRLATFYTDDVGTLNSQVLFTAPDAVSRLTLGAGASNLMAYVISGPTVRSVAIVDGLVFPTVTDATTFRWSSERPHAKGSINGGFLAGGGANLVALSSAASTAVTAFSGAWVQFRERYTNEYRYQLQSQLTHADPSLYDPVAFDGDLISGGTYTFGADPVTGSYSLDGQLCNVSFLLASAKLASGLPADIAIKAEGSQLPPVTGGAPAIDNTQSRGDMAMVDADGMATGQKVEFYAGGQGAGQSSQTVLDDVYTVANISTAASPTDNAAAVAGGDRINTAPTGSGTSGLNLVQAMEASRSWNYGQSVSGSNTTTTIDYGTDPATGQPVVESIGGGSFLQQQDSDLNKEVQVRYDDLGAAIDPQRKPVILDATGTAIDAMAEGKPDDIYGAADIVNAQISPHLEGSHWTPKSRANHHGAQIYPIDIYDDWGVARWGAKTGVMEPDLAGDAVPGDGDNPVNPKPIGVEAFRPFYDFDDDGDLDRFWTDDPFDGGYKRIRVMWKVSDGVRQLGDFTASPANNVLVTGIKKPKLLDDGSYAVEEDVLFSVGFSHRPFHHRKFKWSKGTYITYYTGSLITPLDPYSATDKTLYQLALRNLTVLDQDENPSEGASPEDLVPASFTAWVEIWNDANADGLKTNNEVTYRRQTANFYPGLVPYIDPAEGQWTWSEADFTLLPAIADQPGVPVRVTEVIQDFDGNTISSRIVSRPWDYSIEGDATSPKVLFDASLIPVQDPDSSPSTPVSDRYMWDYPRDRSTAQGGTEVADPDAWKFPWNCAWRNDEHSRRRSKKAFTLNSANMGYFPSQYATMSPKITHEGLTADVADGGTMRVQFLLRETEDQDPPATKTEDEWRDGLAHFGDVGWTRGMEWWESGRAPFHVFDWDSRTDMHPNTLSNEGIRLGSGNRVFEVEATSLAEYLFRGKKYVAHTPAEQLAILRRMWNYYFFAKEFPLPTERCLPSLCIPQRFNNSDLFAKPLSQAIVPATGADQYISADSGDVNRAGAVAGELTQELADPSGLSQRNREATKRRVRLMNEQVFLFSAARGREWELEMARRMPRSTKLVCLEWENKDEVKAILGRDGANVVFPEVQTTYRIGPTGEKIANTVSSEFDILKQLALDWFDGKVTSVGYNDGRMGSESTYSPSGGDRTTVNGSNAAMSTASDGFTQRLREGLPAALAHYVYSLRSWPMQASRQWAPDVGQAMQSDVTVEFRHPMLVLYHDRASSIYVHYGRNCDPDEVFGHWDDCAAPLASLDVESPEFRRRQRFEAWVTKPKLEDIYNRLHPAEYSEERASQIELPPAPINPGSEPLPPTAPPWPGDRPLSPVLALRNWDTYGSPASYTSLSGPTWPGQLDGYSNTWAPWNGLPAYAGLTPRPSWDLWVSGIQKYDMTKTGWLRVRMSGQLGSGSIIGGPSNWLNGAADELLPLGNPGKNTSSILYGIVSTRHTDGRTQTNDVINFYNLNTGALVTGVSWPRNTGLTVPTGEYKVIASNDPISNGNIYFMVLTRFITFDRLGRPVVSSRWDPHSWAEIAHPMTIPYYNALQLKAQADWYQGISDERQAVLSTADAQWNTYVQQVETWETAMNAYVRYDGDQSVYETRHAIWAAQNAEWVRWQTDNASLIAIKARAAQFLANRASWIALVMTEIEPSGVSWSGDPGLIRSTLEEIRAIDPQLPIWEAYGWTIDPVNSVIEVLSG